MFLASARRFALGALLVGAAACSSGSESALQRGGGGGASSMPTVRFAVDGVLTAGLGQAVSISLIVTGDSSGARVSIEGEYADAFLTESDVTAKGGAAEVTLHTPTVPDTFSLRARVPGALDARLDVAVSAGGFATLRVLPEYHQQRPAGTFVGSVFVNARCADLVRDVPKDGAPLVSSPAGVPILISSVPAGGRIAVMTRIAHYAAGCTDLETLIPSTVQDVTVHVLDRPIATDATNLEAIFSFAPTQADSDAWTRIQDLAIARAGDAFIPASSNEAAALLDAMRALVPGGAYQAQFDAQRSQQGWDGTTTATLSVNALSLRGAAANWLNQARPDTLSPLAAHIGNGPSPGTATFSLEALGNLSASKAGLSALDTFQWTADATDTVHLSGSIAILPTALICAAADGRAAQAVAFSTDVASALARKISCDKLGSAMVGSGASYGTCDATCTSALCASALSAMWKTAATASATMNESSVIAMTASAPATVGEYAEPTHFAGTWVGQVTASTGVSSLQGNALANGSAVPH